MRSISVVTGSGVNWGSLMALAGMLLDSLQERDLSVNMRRWPGLRQLESRSSDAVALAPWAGV